MSQHETAQTFIRDWHFRTGAWPSIKQIVYNAGVGTGTAWRALRYVRLKVGE